jgi:Arc/MetJ-type ribon-helix-helix transcriptional regulator
MIIRLSKDLEQIVHDAVRAGLYAREDDVIRDALLRLKDEMPKEGRSPRKKARNARSAKDKRLTDALNQRLIAAGLVSQLPDPSQDIDDDDPDDQPIDIPGEPVSETIGLPCRSR